ncbi:HAD domain-containing protein [Demequina rhizosphaerae]|uniref:HAD domain-containing protein n=1 Tax=Demequina rhizosphaerae TaxID=1638985 RepID=UPI000783487C|nr:HAD domain-containing protein [Demequina rhizosphaerae]
MTGAAARPLLLLDFDGVLNIDASRGAYKKNPAVPRHWQQKLLHADGMAYRVRYSWEVVRRLNHMRVAYGFEWLWLTTWREHGPQTIRPALRTLDDGHIAWNASDGQGHRGYERDPNGAAKTAHVEWINGDEARPFVWIDDEAVRWFDPSRLRTPVEHLAVQTDPMWGLTNDDLDRVEEFFAAHPSHAGPGEQS